MRFDFHADKRLMAAGDASGNGGVMTFEDQLAGIEAGLTSVKDPAQKQAILQAMEKLKAAKAAVDKNRDTVGTAGTTAAAGVMSKASQDSQENGMIAARNAQDLIKSDIMAIIEMVRQSGVGLMQAEQSIEQVKAGFSGMLQVLGIVAKHLGAEEFGQSCLDLATELKPQLVTMNANAKKAVQDVIKDINAHPELTQGYIVEAQKNGEIAIRRGESAVVEHANRGAKDAGALAQPTGFGNGNADHTGGGSPPALSAAVRKHFGHMITEKTLTGAQGSATGDLLVKSDANHDGKLDAGEQREFGKGAIHLLGAATAAKVNKELGVTGAPNAAPLVIAGPNPNGAMGGN